MQRKTKRGVFGGDSCGAPSPRGILRRFAGTLASRSAPPSRFRGDSRHRAKGPFRMSRNRACADIGLTAGSASGGQNSGLCIGRGRKSALCIGFGREPGPFPPRREAPARLLSQKPSSRARLRLEAPQGGFRTYAQSRFLAGTYTQSPILSTDHGCEGLQTHVLAANPILTSSPEMPLGGRKG